MEDIAGGLWACAQWMAPLGRKAADEAAGEDIPFQNDKSKLKDVPEAPAHDKKVAAPLFNLVSGQLVLFCVLHNVPLGR